MACNLKVRSRPIYCEHMGLSLLQASAAYDIVFDMLYRVTRCGDCVAAVLREFPNRAIDGWRVSHIAKLRK